jgi:hypothetical protein
MEAYLKADTDFLERAHAEEAIIVNLDGTISSKGQDLSELAKKDTVFTSLKMTEVKVRDAGRERSSPASRRAQANTRAKSSTSARAT